MKAINEEPLIYIFKKLLTRMSYHNAAERNHRDEITARTQCRKHLQETTELLLSRDIPIEDLKNIVRAGEYLVSDADWQVRQ